MFSLVARMNFIFLFLDGNQRFPKANRAIAKRIARFAIGPVWATCGDPVEPFVALRALYRSSTNNATCCIGGLSLLLLLQETLACCIRRIQIFLIKRRFWRII